MNKEVTILMKLTDRASAGFRNVSRSFGDAIKNIQNSIAGAKKTISDYVKGMQEGSEKARAFADGLKTIAIGAGIVAGAVTLAVRSAISAAIEMESLKLGLASVAGSAEAAEMQMKDLQEVAKLPGLGLQEAIQGSTRLQAVGINAQLANKALMEFGNALARVGKGREELSGVIIALTQIVGKGKVTADEINQIAERVPEVRKVMMEAFGTASTEAIQKMNISAEAFIETMVEGFSKLPRVVSGTRNEIENFNDAVFQAKVAVGQALLPMFTQVLGVLINLVGWFNQLSGTEKSMITWAGTVVGGIAALVATFGGLLLILPQIIAGAQALGITLAGLSAASGPIGLALAGVAALTIGIGYLVKKHQEAQITSEKFAMAIGKINKEVSEVNKISVLANELSTLQAKTTLTQAESARLYEVQKQLTEISPSLIAGYDAQGRVLSVSMQKVRDYAVEQLKILNVEKEVLQLRAKQKATESGKRLEQESKKLSGMNKEYQSMEDNLSDVAKIEMAIAGLPTKKEALGQLSKQAEKVRKLREEYNNLMNEIKKTETLPIYGPPAPEKTKVAQAAQEIAKLSDDIRKAEAQTAEIRAGLNENEQQRELELLRVRHEATIKGVDARLAEMKGATSEEIQLIQALNDQKVALEKQYHQERQQIIDDALMKEADESQKRLNEWVKNRVQAGVAATKAEEAYRKEQQKSRINHLKEQTHAWADYWNDVAETQMKAEKEAAEYHKAMSKIRIGPTETYFKIRQAQIEQETEANRLAYEARWNDFSLFNKRVIEAQDKQVEEFIQSTEEMTVSWKEARSEISHYFGNLEIQLGNMKTDIGTVSDALQALESIAKDGNITIGEGMAIGKAWQDIWSGIAADFNKSEQSVRGFNEEWKLLTRTHQGDEETLKRINKIYGQMMAYTAGGMVMPSKESRDWWKELVKIASSEESRKLLENIKNNFLAGVDFAESLKSPLQSSWKELWQAMLDPNIVLDPLKNFADTLDEMIFNQLVEVFTRSPELLEKARELGEYIAFALNDGIISQTEKYEIDRYRALLVKEYQENTEKLMTAVDVLDLQLRQSRETQQEAKDWMDFTKVGIVPQGGSLRDLHLEDVLMKPQQSLWENMSSPQETMISGRALGISDVVETKPGVTFVQNNQFSGLVNFDNPEAMRELALKLLPYSEELQERWVTN